MIKKTISITSLAILVAAISVAATMTMVQADTTNDTVIITVPQAIQVGPTLPVGGGVEYTGTIGTAVNAIVTFTDGPPNGIPNGMVDASTFELVVTQAGTNVPNGIFTFPSAIMAVLDAKVTFMDLNADKSVQINELVVTNGGVQVLDGPATILATPFDTCVEVTKGNSGKAATGIECNDVTDVNTTVTITTRESPGKGHKDANRNSVDVFKPTFCGPFPVNDGAQAILLDGIGEVVFSTLGIPIPIVLDFTLEELATSVDTGLGLFDCFGELKP